MRAALVVSALDTLRELNKSSSSILRDRLDFLRIGLLGHSRGGDAVVRAAKIIASQRPEYRVKFVCSLAPTDFSGQAKPSQRMGWSHRESPCFAAPRTMTSPALAGPRGWVAPDFVIMIARTPRRLWCSSMAATTTASTPHGCRTAAMSSAYIPTMWAC